MATASRIPPEVPQDVIRLDMTEDEAWYLRNELNLGTEPHLYGVRNALRAILGTAHTFKKKDC